LNKEINISQVFEKGGLADIRGLTTGKGLVGPVKRFGITLKSHKSEKGVRRPGSLGPWHPARVTYMAPQAGQLGMFTRAVYNSKILDISKPEEREIKNIKNFGDIKTDYLILRGSVQGPCKRQLILTAPLRKTKEQFKKEMEIIELK
jgi:large subunit ribosomal protein L3